MTGLLRQEQRRRPVTVGFSTIGVQNLMGFPRLDAGCPVVVEPDGIVDQSVCSSQQRTAFTGCRNECGNIDQMADPLQTSDDRSAIRVPQHNRRHSAFIHDHLHNGRVGSKGTTVQTRNLDSEPVPPQAVRQPVKVRGLMPQAMNEYDLSLLSHPHSLRRLRGRDRQAPSQALQAIHLDWECPGRRKDEPSRLWFVIAQVSGEGRPLVAIHGFGVDHRIMLPLEEVIDGAGWQRIYVDLPWAEGNAEDQASSADHVAQGALDDIQEYLGDQPFAVIGNSYGGMIARHIAHELRDQVLGLATLAGVFEPVHRARTLPLRQVVRNDPSVLARAGQ